MTTNCLDGFKCNQFEFEIDHVLERLQQRYPGQETQEDILVRVKQSLIKHTPDGWRFTESATSRFFIIDEASCAKFMGMTIRDSLKIRGTVDFIQTNLKNTAIVLREMDNNIKIYHDEILNPNLHITHYILTVYPKGSKGDISEERDMFEKSRDAVGHVVPIASRKLGSRPNAIVTSDGALWVRQYMNWMDLSSSSHKEYYLFQPLTRESGVIQNRFRIYTYNENGVLQSLSDLEKSISCEEKRPGIKDFMPDLNTDAIRSESYWKVPTYLDRRLVDLTFKERHSMKLLGKHSKAIKDDELITADELSELYYLRIIVEKVKDMLHKK